MMNEPETKHEICGRLQIETLRQFGLKPHHRVLDIGCGWLRGGQYLIRYLDAGNYVGLDKDKGWLDKARGLLLADHELRAKEPTIRETATFRLYPHESFEFAWAFSVFTHLDEQQVDSCFASIRGHVACLLATYNRASSMILSGAHPRRVNEYTRVGYPFSVLAEIALRNGYRATDRGVFGHPSGQQLGVFDDRDTRSI